MHYIAVLTKIEEHACVYMSVCVWVCVPLSFVHIEPKNIDFTNKA